MRTLAALVLVAVACHKPAATTEAGAPASCAKTAASYESLMAAGGACKTDDDCTCARGGVSQRFPCGDPTDKVTETKLEKLMSDYEAAHCDALMCAATICRPKCYEGHCMRVLDR